MKFQDFRDWWGLPTKTIHRCPICDVETKKGRQCATHKVRERNVRLGRIKSGGSLQQGHQEEPKERQSERDDVGDPR
jgi:hypothetical protein